VIGIIKLTSVRRHGNYEPHFGVLYHITIRCSDPAFLIRWLCCHIWPMLKLLIKKCRYWHRVTEGHESRREAPGRGKGLGSGCSPPHDRDPGVFPPGNFIKFETQFGAIWYIFVTNWRQLICSNLILIWDHILITRCTKSILSMELNGNAHKANCQTVTSIRKSDTLAKKEHT